MAKLLIIADDLTGAIDSGVQLAKRGVTTVVVPALQDLDRKWECETLVVNTETRHASPASAANAVTRATAIGRNHGVSYFYKKTDSTLRGNIGSELEALLRIVGQERLVFVPAFPRLGRTTREGRQYVNGVELQETEYARDPLNPIQTGNVGELIRQQSDVEVHNVTAAELTAPATCENRGIYVVDCSTEQELQEISAALRKRGWHKTLAGSGGFADHLTGLLELSAGLPCATGRRLPERMLVVNGSLNPAAARQLAHAESAGFSVIRFNADLLRDESQAAGWDNVIGAVQEQTASQVVLTPTPPAQALGDQAMREIADTLGRLAATAMERAGYRLLMVIGGDTLAGVTRALQCRSIIPMAEIEAGIALSRCETKSGDVFVVSKAGGFGTDDVLPRIREWVRREAR